MQIALPGADKDYRESGTAEKGTRRAREFLAKFNHDWMMLSAAGLAYSLMVAVVPIGIALIAVLGFTLGSLNPAAQTQMVDRINHIFPSAISSQNVLQPALTRLSSSAGVLTVLAVIVAIIGGSRLFVAIERCFDIVYRTYPRRTGAQYIMALTMMLIFIVLTPIMILVSSAPALILSLIQSSAFNQVPAIAQLARNSFVLSAASILGGLLVAWILFQAIYMVVPNQDISFRKSWKGALVAAVLLELFLTVFPFYITHFMSSYTGVVGFAVIFLLFFYYFALILLLGAQVNAYFAEGVGPLPNTLAVVLLEAVGQHPEGTISSTLDQAKSEQDATEHKDTPQARQESASTKRGLLSFLGKKEPSARTVRPATKARPKHEQKGALLPTVVGTGLALGLTLARLRKKQQEAQIAKTVTKRQKAV